MAQDKLAMVQKIKCRGYKEVMALLDAEKNSKDDVYVLFTGSKDETNQSWCPDCVTAEPVINKVLETVQTDAKFIVCEVGSRDYWKDQNNEFRTDTSLKLKGVPTLLKWKDNKRLQEEQLFSSDLVSMLFEDN